MKTVVQLTKKKLWCIMNKKWKKAKTKKELLKKAGAKQKIECFLFKLTPKVKQKVTLKHSHPRIDVDWFLHFFHVRDFKIQWRRKCDLKNVYIFVMNSTVNQKFRCALLEKISSLIKWSLKQRLLAQYFQSWFPKLETEMKVRTLNYYSLKVKRNEAKRLCPCILP